MADRRRSLRRARLSETFRRLMLLTLFRKEWLLLRADRALWLTVGCYVLLLAYGAGNSVLHVRAQHRALAAAQADELERWQKIKDDVARLTTEPGKPRLFSDVTSPSLIGWSKGPRYAILPVSELAALSAGETRPHHTLVTIFSRRESGREEIDNPVNAVAGKFDLSFVVIYVLPLALLALCYNLVAGERERGTWPLLLSLGVAPRTLVAARGVWRAGLLLLPTAIIGAAACALGNARWLSAQSVLLWLLWLLAVSCYAALWSGLAVWLSARLATSAAAILALIAVWVLLVMMIPSLIHALALKAYPPTDRLAQALITREINVDLNANLPQMYEWYYAQHPATRPAPELVAAANKPIPGGSRSSDVRRTYAPSLYLDAQLQPALSVERARQLARHRLVQGLSTLSPALALQLLQDELAGESFFRHAHFERLIDQFQEEWRAFFGTRIMQLAKLSASDYELVPQYRFSPEPRAEVAKRLLLLLTPLALVAALLIWRARRAID